MRKEIFDNSILIKNNKWVQLREIKTTFGSYVFSHEKRCSGEITAFLPFKISDKNEIEILFRNEIIPCWEVNKRIISSFTGGLEENLTPQENMLKELKEEAGYINISEDNISYLGTCFGTKSTDTLYHLFMINLSNYSQEMNLEVESNIEQFSNNTWVKFEDIFNGNFQNIMDPIANTILLRFLKVLD